MRGTQLFICRSRFSVAVLGVLGLAACGEADSGDVRSGGSDSAAIGGGQAAAAGSATAVGGQGIGGASSTGANTEGLSTGGSPTGGSATGGTSSGLVNTGGSPGSGGAANGGVSPAGNATGGLADGGLSSGGTSAPATGGASTGGRFGGLGSGGTGGMASGGASTGGRSGGGPSTGGHSDGGAPGSDSGASSGGSDSGASSGGGDSGASSGGGTSAVSTGGTDSGGAGAGGGETGGAAALEPVTVYVAGDSTVSEYPDTASTTDQAGWGQMLHEYYDPLVTVDNRARGGRTALWFALEGEVDRILSTIRPGDYFLIQFGTNDSNSNPEVTFTVDGVTYPRYAAPDTDFKEHLLDHYLTPTLAAGAIPVLVTPPPRNSAYCTGGNSLGAHSQAMRELGADQGVAVVDLNKNTVEHLIAICPSPTPEDFFLIKSDGSVDGTHFQENGARILAGFVANGIGEAGLGLDEHRI